MIVRRRRRSSRAVRHSGRTAGNRRRRLHTGTPRLNSESSLCHSLTHQSCRYSPGRSRTCQSPLYSEIHRRTTPRRLHRPVRSATLTTHFTASNTSRCDC